MRTKLNRSHFYAFLIGATISISAAGFTHKIDPTSHYKRYKHFPNARLSTQEGFANPSDLELGVIDVTGQKTVLTHKTTDGNEHRYLVKTDQEGKLLLVPYSIIPEHYIPSRVVENPN